MSVASRRITSLSVTLLALTASAAQAAEPTTNGDNLILTLSQSGLSPVVIDGTTTWAQAFTIQSNRIVSSKTLVHFTRTTNAALRLAQPGSPSAYTDGDFSFSKKDSNGNTVVLLPTTGGLNAALQNVTYYEATIEPNTNSVTVHVRPNADQLTWDQKVPLTGTPITGELFLPDNLVS